MTGATQAARDQIAAAIVSAGKTREAAGESQKSSERHVEVRQDQVEDEPRLAQKAARAGRATFETLDEIRGEAALGHAGEAGPVFPAARERLSTTPRVERDGHHAEP